MLWRGELKLRTLECWAVVAGLALGAGCAPAGPDALNQGPRVLDPRFGDDGVVSTSLGCDVMAYGSALAVRPNGRFLVSGAGCGGWFVSQYRADGALDPAFGDAGTTFLFSEAKDWFRQAEHLFVRPDGRLLLAGVGGKDDGNAVRLLSPEGAEDLLFSAAADGALVGVVEPGFGLQALAVFPDGQLLIGNGETTVRLGLDGQRDGTWGTGGVATAKLFGGQTFLTNLAVNEAGQIAVVGLVTRTPYGLPFVALLKPDGTTDPAFTPFELPVGPLGFGKVSAVAFQPDGKLVLAGAVKSSDLAHFRPVLWRVNPNGTLDRTFGANGEAEAPTGGGDCAFTRVEVTADGRLVAGGSYEQKVYGSSAWLVSRFMPSGALDDAFALGGSTVFSLGSGYQLFGVQALAVTPEGYLLAGQVNASAADHGQLALVKLIP